MPDINRASVTGRVACAPAHSHSIYNEDFFIFSLEVQRLSGTADVLPVIAAGSTLAMNPIAQGDCVCAVGQLRSYNRIVEGKSRLELRVFAKRLLPGSEASNSIELSGWLCKDPVYRTTPFGREIADMLLAVNRQYGKSDYIPAICWGRSAQVAGMLETGARVCLSGRLQSREYEKLHADGTTEKRVAYEVSCMEFSGNG